MSVDLSHILHHALFGGIAAAGFGILFNCSPRIILHCFGSGALALAVRTLAFDAGASLPVASFLAAFTIAISNRTWLRAQSVRGSVLAVVGCIPMVPGSLAARGLENLFILFRATQAESAAALTNAFQDLVIVVATFIAIGAALAVPTLIFPTRQHAEVE